jgi:hypothetical protein
LSAQCQIYYSIVENTSYLHLMNKTRSERAVRNGDAWYFFLFYSFGNDTLNISKLPYFYLPISLVIFWWLSTWYLTRHFQTVGVIIQWTNKHKSLMQIMFVNGKNIILHENICIKFTHNLYRWISNSNLYFSEEKHILERRLDNKMM